MFCALLSRLVKQPSRRFSSLVVSVHVSDPYNKTGSIRVLKVCILSEFGRFDCHMVSSLLHAFHARAFLILKSFSGSAMCEPRYLKSSTRFINELLRDLISDSSEEVVMYWVLLSLQCRPT